MSDLGKSEFSLVCGLDLTFWAEGTYWFRRAGCIKDTCWSHQISDLADVEETLVERVIFENGFWAGSSQDGCCVFVPYVTGRIQSYQTSCAEFSERHGQ